MRLIRVRQWPKNGAVLTALIFSGLFTQVQPWLTSLFGVMAFCAVSSGVYVLNDIIDVERDRHHPKKRLRPIAAKLIPISRAWLLALVLLALGLGASFCLNGLFGTYVGCYVALNVAYGYWLKHVMIVDTLVLSSGFVIRALSGAVIVHVPISSWLILCAFLLSLFLATNKRLNELGLLGEGAQSHRSILAQYSKGLLEQYSTILASTTILAYALYSVLGPHPTMVYTVPFPLYGIFRYLYLSRQGYGGSPEEVLLHDVPTMVAVLGWGAAVMTILLISP